MCRSLITDNKQSRSTASNLESERNRGVAECLFLNRRPLGVVFGKAVDRDFLNSAFFTFLIQKQPRIDTMIISGFFGQTTIHSPAAISIGNEPNVVRDIIFHIANLIRCPRRLNRFWSRAE